ncbi:MAG: DNA-processing protein DprA, partial [Synergistaceae bacterium]|nr:DNA-processing protein DprA [Synergistaceae bacterium]
MNAIRAPQKIFSRLCSDYDPEELWSSQSIWQELGLKARMTERLKKLLLAGWVESEEERLENFDARFITSFDIDYPAKLFDLSNPPVGLYVKGSVNLSQPSVAIVGTRKCSEYAWNVAMNLGRALAQSGVMTVSGGAKGIDTAGHVGTLAADGVTVVIFGTGLDKTYPAENRELFAKVLERGSWVSEYPFGTGGNIWQFPERDRLISAMASRVVIAESPEDGGAMYTARRGLKLHREVWSIPGRITDDASKGSNILLREGSNVFISISEFIKTVTNCQLNDSFSVDNKNFPELSDEAKIVYSIIQRKDKITLDEIKSESGLDDV